MTLDPRLQRQFIKVSYFRFYGVEQFNNVQPNYTYVLYVVFTACTLMSVVMEKAFCARIILTDFYLLPHKV